MGFLDKIFNKIKVKESFYCGKDSGCYVSKDSKFGIFLEGSDEETRKKIREELVEQIEKITSDDIKGSIRELLENINEKLYLDKKELSGIVFYMDEKYIEMLHIGISRAYIIRENEIIQLTEDDSQGWNLFKTGVFTEERLKSSPLNKMTTKSFGKGKSVQVNTNEYYFSSNEKLLILSGEAALKFGDEKLYESFAGPLDIAIEKLGVKSYLLKVFS